MAKIGHGSWFLTFAMVAIAIAWTGCSKNQGAEEQSRAGVTSPIIRAATVSSSQPRAVADESAPIRLVFRSAHYSTYGPAEGPAYVTVTLGASSAHGTTNAYLMLPDAYEVDSPLAMAMPVTCVPGLNSPEMHVYALTGQPQEVLLNLRYRYQFNLAPGDIKESRAISFRLRYYYQRSVSNWIDCRALPVAPDR